ncbi:MAG: sulfatase [Pseudomonadota bacterium]|nr:sulfatase [Pseudomonadota bacterium]
MKIKTLARVLVSVFTVLTASSIAAQSRQPNIVFIFADDLGYADTSVYGSEEIRTPHIDALAGEGIRFTQGYVSHPVCSPSRAGLLTGRYQQRHGWEFNPARRDGSAGMDINERTIADALKAQGYTTGMIGKWHLGHGEEHHPLSRGFDEYFGVLAGGSQFFETLPEGGEYARNDAPTKRTPYNGIYRGREQVQVDEYLTDVFSDEAIAFIDNHADDPFFLYLSHTTPHTPLQATKQYLDRYGHIRNMASRVYAAMVSSLDDSVGRVVQKLKDIGQYENTIIAFLSDNGCAGYISNACSNGELAGFKRYHQEGGIRIPFILSWPAELEKNRVLDTPVISLDLFGTFTAAAGQEIETEDTVNLLPYLKGEEEESPHDFLYWRSGATMAIRDERWKLIKFKLSDFDDDAIDATGRLMPPAGGWGTDAPLGHKLVLYDLLNDPGETANLAAQYPDIVERLEAEYAKWNVQLPPASEAILPGLRSIQTEIDGSRVQLIF